MKVNNTSANQLPVCHYTHDEDVILAEWLTKGCKTHNKNYVENGVKCVCDHLTSFVILMKPEKNENNILSLLTQVGLSISIVFLIITLVTICVFKDLRNSERYKILRHLVIALLCVNCFFLLLEVDVEKESIACSVLAGFLHYSLLAAFSWMLIISTDLYMKIKRPFADHSKRFTYSRFFGWTGPAIVVAVTAGITRKNYASDECWLDTESGTIWSFIPIVCLTNLIVIVQLCVIGYVVFKKSKIPNQSEEEMQMFIRIRNMFHGILLLAPAVGLSWIFGVIVIFCDWKVVEYIYVVLNSMQGFFVWLSQCAFSNEVRQGYRKRVSNLVNDDSSVATVISVTYNRNRVVIEHM
ncbi:adhesion G protein-coupled receptor L4-like [Anneissia japonica]|uniref:adhesion G protein-coupled receptor L4-like n=1 Tax=Anneissia japonica TaxID=1529436 RepID=UPI001425B9E1|nr:adhesion G protein-coupled receptor L4-like [Anneissia japonica]